MPQLTPEIPFMASLWIRCGYDMKLGKSVETHQVGAHFEAHMKAILVAPSRALEKFFSFHASLPRCGHSRACLTLIVAGALEQTNGLTVLLKWIHEDV